MNKKKLAWVIFIISTCISTVCFYCIDPTVPYQAFFAGCLLSVMPALIIPHQYYKLKWRYENGVDLFATLETDPERVKARMLHIMQWGHDAGIVGAIQEFSFIFRNYPQWHLSKWEVFRAWYKDQIDHMVKYPNVYNLTMKDGSPYIKENDPLYDPNALDWEQFDRDHSYEQYDDSNNDDDLDKYENKETDVSDAIAFGIGFGIADNILNNSNN